MINPVDVLIVVIVTTGFTSVLLSLLVFQRVNEHLDELKKILEKIDKLEEASESD